MTAQRLIGLASAAALAGGALAYALYRQDMKVARADLLKWSSIAQTSAGPIEYADVGEGAPVLVIHGAGGGYDQGLLIGRDLGSGYRVIAPSRFGYLRTPIPQDNSPAAQADAHAALLDHLEIPRCVVMGTSAGAPSAIELALRRPSLVSALILLVPRTYDPTSSIGPDASLRSQAVLRVIESSADFVFWMATKLARSAVVRFLGVPPEVEANAPKEERARVTEIINSVRPLADRVAGIMVDSAAEISEWPLATLDVPTLVITAKDDLYGTLNGARYTAEHIPNAELHVFETGGHLMVGQGERVKEWIGGFLERCQRAPQLPSVSSPRSPIAPAAVAELV